MNTWSDHHQHGTGLGGVTGSASADANGIGNGNGNNTMFGVGSNNSGTSFGGLSSSSSNNNNNNNTNSSGGGTKKNQNVTNREAFEDAMNFIDFKQATAPNFNNEYGGGSDGEKRNLRVTRENLDNVSKAGKSGSLNAYTSVGGEEILKDLERVREKQIEIFRAHMQFDIFAEGSDEKAEFDSKDFLQSWQRDYQKKEKELDKITGNLEALTRTIHAVNKKSKDVGGNVPSMSSSTSGSSGGTTSQSSSLNNNMV